jgi:putative ABC transport system ATP-binding protein
MATATPATGLIDIRDVVKTYRMGHQAVHALRGVSLSIEPGEFVAITGASGSGKSTLMHIIGLLDRPTSGQYRLLGDDVARLAENELAARRNRSIGFVFQSFNLLARTSALKNVELPLLYAGMRARERAERAYAALAQVGLTDRIRHQPSELSGGQQQRVAIARALVTRPDIILADEPTGNLDTQASAEIMNLLVELNRTRGITVILVTHEAEIAACARRLVQMRDGRIIGDGAPEETQRSFAATGAHAAEVAAKTKTSIVVGGQA